MITDLIAHSEQSRPDLEAAYHEARATERAAWQADIDNPYLNHHRFYSRQYQQAHDLMCEAWSNWQAACERGNQQ